MKRKQTRKDDPHHPALTPALRWMSNMIGLWSLCAKPACRRARACQRDPHDCLARYAALVPQAARDGVKAMLEGQRYGLSYDELREDAPDEIAALESWIAQTEAAARPPSR